jgi:hypothetical protein
MPQPSEMETAQKQQIQRAVLLAACRSVGAPEDVARARELFKNRPTKVPRDTFMQSIAESLYEESTLFGPRKLDQPDRLSYFLTHAQDAVKKLPESKQTKDLGTKIQAAMKNVRKPS